MCELNLTLQCVTLKLFMTIFVVTLFRFTVTLQTVPSELSMSSAQIEINLYSRFEEHQVVDPCLRIHVLLIMFSSLVIGLGIYYMNCSIVNARSGTTRPVCLKSQNVLSDNANLFAR